MKTGVNNYIKQAMIKLEKQLFCGKELLFTFRKKRHKKT
jgi:hypothetical protein